MKKFKKSTISDFITGIVLTLLALFAFLLSWGPLETLEYGLYDLRAGLRAQQSTAPVALIAIDEQSIANLGRWPWPRASIAAMVDLLHSYNVKVIGLDIIYSEKDANQGLIEIRNLAKTLEGNSTYDYVLMSLKESETRLDNDAILANSIAVNKNVVLPLFFVPGVPTGRVSSNLPDYLQKNSLAPLSTDNSVTASQLIPPIAEFAAISQGLGHINIMPDHDGTVRSEPLFINFEEKLFPSFALQLTLKYLNIDLKTLRLGQEIKFGRKAIPVNENNRMLISFNTGIPSYSFFDVVNKKVAPDVFKDKIVIIAPTAAGLSTMQVTTTAVNVPPGTIIANVIDNIISNDYIVRPDWAGMLELIMIIVFGLYITLVIPHIKAGISAIVSFVLLLAWMMATIYLFAGYGYWIKALYPALLLLIGYIVIVSKRYLLTEKTKDRIEADSVETNKMLGLSFQGQGLLDMAFDKFRKCPVEDESVKELVYNLGLDFERKRMFNKAVAAYEHIAKAGDFKDIKDRIKKLTAAGETMIFGLSGAKKDSTVIMDNTVTKPTLGRYEIMKELGRGAMGTVFLGKDPRINREVAIKTLRYEEVDAEQLDEVKKRFFREAEAAGKLSHPNIVTIYDVGEDYEIAYMAMELLDGTDLEKYAKKENRLPMEEIIRVAGCVASALDYAHLNGIVHRDIKPANIMMLNNREVKVADFGIARVMATSKTQTGVIMGTPSYMSPEQIAGKKVDGRSDLFSLGVVLYELIAGERPFTGDSIATLMYNITTSQPPSIKELSPDIPDKLAPILEKLLSKDVEARYQNGRELADDLAKCLN
ncbi:MAG: serine/threonine protein kinase [Deltaproteobacteria bacterium HGW-Deltaproteobacteria-6]|jgi:serine/threonine-protein kinase|nr:MAG: serine/threonine protein kinase [Deltaproteobacteria bacterium HGW-Deltaproteobacteria-6]